MSSNFCVCCGAEIPEGTQVCLRCQKNGGPLPHKTADEMFWELGYYQHPEIENCYEHAEEPLRITIEDDGVWFEDDGWRFKEGIREILACAQLIKEMEAKE